MNKGISQEPGSYVIQRGAVLGNLHNLNRSQITGLDTDVGGQWYLRQADSSRVRIIRRTGNLEGRHHWVAHVLGNLAEANVDVYQGRRMAREPARLQSDGAATDGPVSAVCRGWHATT